MLSNKIEELAEESGMTQYVAANNKYLERFAKLVVLDYAKQMVHANMNDMWYVQAMDEYYESKWAHRFD